MGNARAGEYELTSAVRLVGAEAGAIPTFSNNTDNADNVDSAEFDASTGSLANVQTDLFNKSFKLAFQEIDDQGNAYFTLTAQDGTKFTGSVSMTSNPTGASAVSINFGEVGTLKLTVTSGYTITGTPGDPDFDLSAAEEAARNLSGVTLTGIGGEAKVDGTPKAYLKLGDEEVEVFAGDKEVEFRSAGVTVVLKSALTQADLFNYVNGDLSNAEIMMGATAGTDGSGTAIADTITVAQTKGQSLVIQTGANEGDTLRINLDRMNTKMLGVYTTGIATREKASEAITFVNNATNIVSTQRAELGALANRLEHKIANLDTSAENLQAAESRIRDVDMAKEMTNFTKANILSQASTAMLAQANALPQGVLQLLG